MTKTAITDTRIAETAYLLWLDEGQPEGRQDAHWIEARTRLEAAMATAKPARKRAAAKPKADSKSKAAPKAKAAAKPKAAKADDAPKAAKKAPARKRAAAAAKAE